MSKLVDLNTMRVYGPILDDFTIGRTSSNSISINNLVVSGVHCKLSLNHNHKLQVTDLSSNGTFINNIKIGKGNTVVLKNEDILQIAKPTIEDYAGKFKVQYEDQNRSSVSSANTTPSRSSLSSNVSLNESDLKRRRVETPAKTEIPANPIKPGVSTKCNQCVLLQSEKDTLHAELESSLLQAQHKQRRFDELDLRHKQCHHTVNSLNEKISLLESSKDEFSLKCNQLQFQFDKFKAENKQLKESLEIIYNEKEGLATKLMDGELQVDKLKRENHNLQDLRAAMESENEELRATVENMEYKLGQLELSHRSLQEKYNATLKENLSQENFLDALRSEKEVVTRHSRALFRGLEKSKVDLLRILQALGDEVEGSDGNSSTEVEQQMVIEEEDRFSYVSAVLPRREEPVPEGTQIEEADEEQEDYSSYPVLVPNVSQHQEKSFNLQASPGLDLFDLVDQSVSFEFQRDD
jgi:FHA domain